jgi:hypothetical protein
MNKSTGPRGKTVKRQPPASNRKVTVEKRASSVLAKYDQGHRMRLRDQDGRVTHRDYEGRKNHKPH